MAWILLIAAGLLECGWAVGLRYTDGFTKPLPVVATLVALAASMWLLSLAVRSIPIGTAYAVWAGIGSVGVAILGMILFEESRDVIRLVFLLFIVIGIVGLNLFSPS